MKDFLIENLKKNGFEVRFFDKSDAAVEILIKEIPKEKTIGFGGSVTVNELNIVEELIKDNRTVYHSKLAKDPSQRKAMSKNAASAEVYISSANAITIDGRIINIDATGNRISSMLYGHEKVYLICGTNKIAKNYEEAILRIKNQVCGRNAERLNLDTPCRATGKCMNCNSPDRICKATLILEKCPSSQQVIVYLIDEILGY